MRARHVPAIAGLGLWLAVGPGGGVAIPDAVDNLPSHGSAGTRIVALYASSVLLFRVGEITLDARFGNDAYSAESHIEAAGLAALFTDFDIRSEVSGRGTTGSREPARYAHVERTGSKVRSVAVDFVDEIARSDVVPPFGSWGVPPASEGDRTGVIDPMTAFFELSGRLEEGEGCRGYLPVFDGKARYDLRLETIGREFVRTRGWRGDALVCQVWYEPISGYDPEDYPSVGELRHPLVLWLAPVAGEEAYLPVRLHTRAGFGGVTIELTRLQIEVPA